MHAYHRTRSLTWLTLAVGLTTACDSERRDPNGSSGDGSGDQLASYGVETIGYKLQKTEAERAQEASSSPSGQPDATGAASATDDDGGDYDSSDDDGVEYETDDSYNDDDADDGADDEVADDSMSDDSMSDDATAPDPDTSDVDSGPDDAPLAEAGTTEAGTTEAGSQVEGGAPNDAGVVATLNPDAAMSDAAAPLISLPDGSSDAGLLACELPQFDDVPLEQRLEENPFRVAADMPASTFSIDVDTGSYTLARAAIRQGLLPDPERVRIEEFINYFHLHYAQPTGDVPFSIYTEMAPCPWNDRNQLMMVGIQGQEVPLEDQPPANLVFLVDVSGSMNEPNKLPLLQQGFRMITRQLRPQDTVSIVTYAADDRVVLEGASGADKETILAAIDGLRAVGSTNGAGGIQRAYQLAEEYYEKGANNRVLLATDGDFNVGITETSDLVDFISHKRESGVFLSVYGFGSPTGNFQDEKAEQLADNGNGIYFFIDSPDEARRAFVHTITGSLLTVAKDVKLQLQFNEEKVKGYRLVGYENRVLSNADFANDSVDAGELGAGLSATAFFELIPADSELVVPTPAAGTDPLDDIDSVSDAVDLEPVEGDDLVAIRVRYKGADATDSQLIETLARQEKITRDEPSMKFQFASAVAELAMQLRGSQYLGKYRDLDLLDQIELAFPADSDGAVQEFYDMAGNTYELAASR